jgi:hypothetical protein
VINNITWLRWSWGMPNAMAYLTDSTSGIMRM